jgi:hypothetical protein
MEVSLIPLPPLVFTKTRKNSDCVESKKALKVLSVEFSEANWTPSFTILILKWTSFLFLPAYKTEIISTGSIVAFVVSLGG